MTSASPPAPARAAVIANPIKTNPVKLRSAVERWSAEIGWAPPFWRETTVSDPGSEIAREALQEGCTLVIAAGGDGTVRAVAAALRGSDVPLAIVPVGSGNLLARNTGIPLTSVERALELAFTGTRRRIDVGLVQPIPAAGGQAGEEVFVAMAGMGVDATLIANTRAWLKRRVGWLAYVDAGVRSLTRLAPRRLRFAVDGSTARGARISTILVARCGRLPGGIDLFPDAEPDDGLLHVAVLQPRRVLDWFLVWRRVAWRARAWRQRVLGRGLILFGGAGKRAITYLAGKEVIVLSPEPAPFEVDGDAVGMAWGLRFRIDPQALVMMAPKR